MTDEAKVEPWKCDRCGKSPVRDCLDGEALCQSCCNDWARAEGEHARLDAIEQGQHLQEQSR